MNKYVFLVSIRFKSHQDTSLVTNLQGENTGVLSSHGPCCMRSYVGTTDSTVRMI